MKEQNSIRQAIRAFGILSGVGIYIAVVILICLYLGSLADDFFGLDGVGKLAVDSILMRDYPVIQAYVVWMSIIFVFVNLFADLIGKFLNPVVRL